MYQLIQLFDFDFISATDHYQFLDEMINYHAYLQNQQHKLPFVITLNADQLVRLAEPKNSILKQTLTQSLFILPDGQSIILFSRLVGKPLKQRLCGSDLLPLFWKSAKQEQKKLLLIVTSEQIGALLQADYANSVYYAPPFFNLDTQAAVLDKIIQDCVEMIKKIQPEYVLLGLGFPKQETIGIGIYTQLVQQKFDNFPLFLFLGASFEFYLKVKKRAPLWMQSWGLEWLHRLIQEPKRMWKRYLIGAFRLAWLWIKCFPKERRNK